MVTRPLPCLHQRFCYCVKTPPTATAPSFAPARLGYPPPDPSRAWAVGRDAIASGQSGVVTGWNTRAAGAAVSSVRPSNPSVRSAKQLVRPRGSSGRSDGSMVTSSALLARSAIWFGRPHGSCGWRRMFTTETQRTHLPARASTIYSCSERPGQSHPSASGRNSRNGGCTSSPRWV